MLAETSFQTISSALCRHSHDHFHHQQKNQNHECLQHKRMAPSFFVCLFVIFCLLVICCPVAIQGYKYGDFVPMMKRIQFKQRRTGWTEVLPSQAPRFGITKTVHMRGANSMVEKLKQQLDKNNQKGNNDDDDTTPEDEFVKISFSFGSDSHFITPWITISAHEENHFLTQIDFIFRYSGDRIRDVKYHEHYSNALDEDDSKVGAPTRIRVNYHWHEIIEKDTSTALTMLYMFSFVFGTVILFLVLSDISIPIV